MGDRRCDDLPVSVYHAEDCPYCKKVRAILMELSVSYVNHYQRTAGGTTRNQQTLDEKEARDGQDQFPFLIDHRHSVELYEDDDIIEHLEKHYT